MNKDIEKIREKQIILEKLKDDYKSEQKRLSELESAKNKFSQWLFAEKYHDENFREKTLNHKKVKCYTIFKSAIIPVYLAALLATIIGVLVIFTIFISELNSDDLFLKYASLLVGFFLFFCDFALVIYISEYYSKDNKLKRDVRKWFKSGSANGEIIPDFITEQAVKEVRMSKEKLTPYYNLFRSVDHEEAERLMKERLSVYNKDRQDADLIFYILTGLYRKINKSCTSFKNEIKSAEEEIDAMEFSIKQLFLLNK